MPAPAVTPFPLVNCCREVDLLMLQVKMADFGYNNDRLLLCCDL